MPKPRKAGPVSALLLAPLIALSMAGAPVAAATPEEGHCVEKARHIDEAQARLDKNPNSESAFNHLAHALAQYQIHCLGSARPPKGG